jgi:hypothetical protein
VTAIAGVPVVPVVLVIPEPPKIVGVTDAAPANPVTGAPPIPAVVTVKTSDGLFVHRGTDIHDAITKASTWIASGASLLDATVKELG